ncbi:MAG: hypothetical protein WAT39_09795 [Planctomycetota bacterium]
MGKLLDWFGPSRTEIWRKLSAQIGGCYAERTWRKAARIEVVHEHWTITLDTYVVHANNTHIPYPASARHSSTPTRSAASSTARTSSRRSASGSACRTS